MPSINMIAPKRTEKKRLESNLGRLIIVILVEVLSIAFVAGFLITQTYGTRSNIDGLQMQLAKLQPDVHQIEQYEKAIQSIKPKLETLNRAKSDTLRWCRIMDDLSSSMPSDTWLVRVSCPPLQPTSTEMLVNLNGVSTNQNNVGEAMLRMHDIARDFNRIDLQYTKKATVGLRTAVEFEIEAAVNLPDSTEKEVAKN